MTTRELELELLRKDVVCETENLLCSMEALCNAYLKKHPEYQFDELFQQQNQLLSIFNKKIKSYQENHFQDLPTEILNYIFSMLQIIDIDNLIIVCKAFHNITITNNFYEPFVVNWWRLNNFENIYQIGISKVVKLISENETEESRLWGFISKCSLSKISINEHCYICNNGAPGGKEISMGQRKDYQLHGRGITIKDNGVIQFGNFINGKLQGYGKRLRIKRDGITYFMGGIKYEGQFKDGKNYNNGTYKWLNGYYLEKRGDTKVYLLFYSPLQLIFHAQYKGKMHSLTASNIVQNIDDIIKGKYSLHQCTTHNQLCFNCEICYPNKWYCYACYEHCNIKDHISRVQINIIDIRCPMHY